MAVSRGYKNVFRDPYGFPKWQEMGHPTGSSPAGLTSTNKDPANQHDRSLQGWAMVWTLFGVFAGGLALNLTPCVYPMIPITVSFFGGRAGQERPSQIRLVAHGLCYIFGLALTNSILGVIAALTGGLMGGILQSPIVLTAIASVLLVFATSLFGFWELKLPGVLNQAAGKAYSGYFGSLFMGLTLGVVAAPCIGPFVLGLLTWIASVGDPWLGFIVFFTLSLGLGFPLFILAIFSGQLQYLPRAGGWMIWVRRLMGWVLVGMAVYFIRPIIPDGLKSVLPIVVVLTAGLHLGWLEKSPASFQLFPWLKTIVGTVCLAFATFWFTSWTIQGPGVEWQPYSQKTLQDAVTQNKPVIIDFFADWCSPCREFEDVVFRHPDVVGQGGEDFIMVKVDVTKGGNPFNEKLLKKYEVRGVPTIVFLDAKGAERSDLRLVDFLPPDQFLVNMASVRK